MDSQVIKLSRKEHSGKRFRRVGDKAIAATTRSAVEIKKAVIKDVTINGIA